MRRRARISRPKLKITKKCDQVEWHEGGKRFNDFNKSSEDIFTVGLKVWDTTSHKPGHVLTTKVLCHMDTGIYCGMCGHMIEGGHWIWTCECNHMIYADYGDLIIFPEEK